MPKLQKQLVECDKHGPDQLGYVVCAHVISRQALVAHHLPPRPEELGELLCAECEDSLEAGENRAVFDKDNIKLICAPCAAELTVGRWVS